MLNIIRKLRGIPIYLLKKYCNLKNPNFFYGDFIGGGLNEYENKIISIFYRRKTKLKKILEKIDGNLAQYIQKNTNFEINDIVDGLRRDGIIQISSYSQSLANEITNRYINFFKEPKVSNTYKREFLCGLSDKELNEILDPFLIKILSEYEGRQIYLRAPPVINLTYPGIQDETSRQIHSKHSGGYANVWHHDTQYLLQWHVLLKDISIDEPHMIFAKKSINEKFQVIDFHASEEYVLQNYEIHHCVGRAGTVYLFDGSRGWHRMKPAPSGYRFTLEVMFTQGNDIKFDLYPLVQKDKFDLKLFDVTQKNSMLYI